LETFFIQRLQTFSFLSRFLRFKRFIIFYTFLHLCSDSYDEYMTDRRTDGQTECYTA